MQTTGARLSVRPPLWLRMSVTTGNLVQLAGMALGAGLLFLAAWVVTTPIPRVLLMLLGYLAIYLCSHAIAHWAVGRLMGIHFRGYGVRGTDHPEIYPPGLRQLMRVLPFFTALTQRASLQHATPVAQAVMFSAGESATTICSALAAWYAWQSGTPGGWRLLVFTVVWNVLATITTAIAPGGDYAKARRALRGLG